MQITLIARAAQPQKRTTATAMAQELMLLIDSNDRLGLNSSVALIERPALPGGGVEIARWSGAKVTFDLPEDATALMLDNNDGDREVARRLLRTLAVTTRDAAEGCEEPFSLESVTINFGDHRKLAEDSVVRFD